MKKIESQSYKIASNYNFVVNKWLQNGSLNQNQMDEFKEISSKFDRIKENNKNNPSKAPISLDISSYRTFNDFKNQVNQINPASKTEIKNLNKSKRPSINPIQNGTNKQEPTSNKESLEKEFYAIESKILDEICVPIYTSNEKPDLQKLEKDLKETINMLKESFKNNTSFSMHRLEFLKFRNGRFTKLIETFLPPVAQKHPETRKLLESFINESFSFF